MNIISLIFLCVCAGLLWYAGKLWWRMPIPWFSKIMLTLSLLCILPGLVIIWNNGTLGSALVALGGTFSGVESYVRRKKDTPVDNSSKVRSEK